MTTKLIGLFAACIFTLASCNPILYAPNATNIPMHTQAKQTHVEAIFNSYQNTLLGSRSLNDYFAVLATATRYKRKDNEAGQGGSAFLAEMGAGVYAPFQDQFVTEIYGLAGLGRFENHIPVSDYMPRPVNNISAQWNKYSLQTSIGYYNRFLVFALANRISILNYSKIRGNLLYNGRNYVDFLNNNQNQFLIEPSVTLRLGGNRLKIFGQIGLSINLTNNSFPQENGWGSLGLGYTF